MAGEDKIIKFFSLLVIVAALYFGIFNGSIIIVISGFASGLFLFGIGVIIDQLNHLMDLITINNRDKNEVIKNNNHFQV
ncbi:hypothetical protein ACBQ08_28715 [Aneurinibacillus aneurinilyticus]